jgi:hypothetical protein
MMDIETQLDKIEHYNKVPVMKPFIGANYFTAAKKILIIGESHYFDHLPKSENPICNPSASVWYSYKEVIPKEKLNNINTREIVKKANHRIYSNLKSILSDALKINRNLVLESIAYMNAFQRPANHAGVSMAKLCGEKDYEVAVETISEVINILEPNYVIFASKLSWEKIGKRINKNENYKIDYTSHPNSVEWNNSKSKDNKQKFFKILS